MVGIIGMIKVIRQFRSTVDHLYLYNIIYYRFIDINGRILILLYLIQLFTWILILNEVWRNQ